MSEHGKTFEERNHNIKRGVWRLSKSAINLFKACPYMFWLTYIKKAIPDDGKVPPALKKGIEVHDMLDSFYNVPTKNLNYMIEKLRNHPLYNKYKKIAENFICFHKRLPCFKVPIMTEKKMFNDRLDFTGIVDVVHKDEQGNVAVIDYKTGRKHTKVLEDGSRTFDDKFLFELAIYAWMVEDHYKGKVKVTHYGIFFVEHDDFPMLQEVDRKVMMESVKEIMNTRKKLAISEWPKQEHPYCWSRCTAYINGLCKGPVEEKHD